jgi:HEPN domain-containing protein
MKPLALEWIEKAEGDLATAFRELQARKRPNYDAACFHAQQVAEKYLKGFLQENQAEIPYTHNLIDLSLLCIQMEPAFHLIQADLKSLEGYAVRFRYPGQKADKAEAKNAVKVASAIRTFIRGQLNLP